MGDNEENHNSIAHQFNGKIMIGSVAILFVACFVIVLFHVYLRWCRSRLTRHQNRLPTRYQPEFSIAVDACPKGLDLRLIKSLPTFVYSTERDESPLECAVCLSEFEENETGRVLPECNHCFHVDCVDMWLQSHSDCPLCRAHVKAQPIEEPVEPIEDPHEVVIVICINEPDDKGSGSNSGSQSATQKH